MYERMLLDCGAYTASRKGIELDPERVKYIQEKIDPDKAIPLDYPFLPGMSIVVMKKRWRKTQENILDWQETTRLKEIVPVLHAWSPSSLINNIKWMQKYADCKYVAVGTIVTTSYVRYTGYFADREPNAIFIKMLSYAIWAIKKFSDFRVHLTGFGSSPLTLHLGFYLGIDSLDTAGHRRKAAYGKIILPSIGERYVGDRNAKFGVTRLTDEEMEILRKCKCPVCRIDQSALWRDWKARAIHNKYVMEREAEKASRLISEGLEVYERYLDDVFGRTSTKLRSLWRLAKVLAKNYKLEDFMVRV